MKAELDRELFRKYPKIFGLTKKPGNHPHYPIYLFHLECGDGWYNIIDALCANIQSHINHSRKERARALRYNRALTRAVKGDMSGLYHYYSFGGKLTDYGKNIADGEVKEPRFKTVPDAVCQTVAVQVKEKFGGLRFYTNSGDDIIYAYISMAESMSYRTCEVCGSPGKVYRDGWHTTLCSTHAAEQNREDILEEEENAE